MEKPSCQTRDCTRAADKRGRCEPCYLRYRRSAEFQRIDPGAGHVKGWHRLTETDEVAKTAICAICGPTRIRIRAGRRGNECWSKRLPRKGGFTTWPQKLRHKYGLSIEDWHALLVEQSGLCAICTDPLSEPCVDHDHSDGRVRGILCRPCNLAIGFMRDDPCRLREAARYLG